MIVQSVAIPIALPAASCAALAAAAAMPAVLRGERGVHIMCREGAMQDMDAILGRLMREADSLDVRMATHYTCHEPLLGPEHAHPDRHHFTFIVKGSCSVVIGGRRYPVRENDMIYAGPGQVHGSLGDRDSDFELIEVKFFPADMGAFAGAMPPLPSVIHFGEPASILSALRRLVEAKRLEGVVTPSLVPLYTVEMIVLCVREAAHQGGALHESPEPERAILQVARHISLHYREKLTVAALAAIVYKSPSHFSVCFRRVMGVTPIQYLNRTRLQRAAELLVHTGLSVTEVADLCGFSSPQYLARILRRQEGCSPTSFRRRRTGTRMP